MNKKLYYFTNSYPFGIGEQWKYNELKVLVNYFEQIYVIPYSYAGNFDQPKQLPEGVELLGPLFKDESFLLTKKDILKIIFSKYVLIFFKEFIIKEVYKKKIKFISWFSSSLNSVRLLNHPIIKRIIKNADKDTTLYFFWGKGSCEFIPFIETNSFNKILIKMHRYDLYNYANNGYIPYRSYLLNKPIIIAPSSEDGELHLKSEFPNHNAQIYCLRCGTIGNGLKSNFSKDNKLRIVSCSFLSPVKRIDIMLEACSLLTIPFEWDHIGNGILEKELKQQLENLNLVNKFRFVGEIKSTDILEYYTNNTFDVFVNTSKSEGVPFSIMEAFSVGIPVFATNVGGTREIVNDQVGKLLDENITPVQLAKYLQNFYFEKLENKLKYRENAYEQYLNMCNADKLANELGKILTHNA